MASTEERMTILRMVEQGKITPEEGARLMSALGDESRTPPPRPYSPEPPLTATGRNFRVRVSNLATGKQKVNINIPVGLVDFGLRFVPANAKFDVQAVRDALVNGVTGRIVEVMDEEKGDRVEIYIE
jgi:hypothetical protein